jgi:hypothetical protein
VKRKWALAVLTSLLAAIAGAGLFATTTNELRVFAPIGLNGVWLAPGLILIGALLATANLEGTWSAGAMGAAAVLGATLYGAAIAAPGIEVAPIRTTMINDGTVQGLAAFLLLLIFGMIGVVGSLVVRTMLGRGDI